MHTWKDLQVSFFCFSSAPRERNIFSFIKIPQHVAVLYSHNSPSWVCQWQHKPHPDAIIPNIDVVIAHFIHTAFLLCRTAPSRIEDQNTSTRFFFFTVVSLVHDTGRLSSCNCDTFSWNTFRKRLHRTSLLMNAWSKEKIYSRCWLTCETPCAIAHRTICSAIVTSYSKIIDKFNTDHVFLQDATPCDKHAGEVASDAPFELGVGSSASDLFELRTAGLIPFSVTVNDCQPVTVLFVTSVTPPLHLTRLCSFRASRSWSAMASGATVYHHAFFCGDMCGRKPSCRWSVHWADNIGRQIPLLRSIWGHGRRTTRPFPFTISGPSHCLLILHFLCCAT